MSEDIQAGRVPIETLEEYKLEDKSRVKRWADFFGAQRSKHIAYANFQLILLAIVTIFLIVGIFIVDLPISPLTPFENRVKAKEPTSEVVKVEVEETTSFSEIDAIIEDLYRVNTLDIKVLEEVMRDFESARVSVDSSSQFIFYINVLSKIKGEYQRTGEEGLKKAHRELMVFIEKSYPNLEIPGEIKLKD